MDSRVIRDGKRSDDERKIDFDGFVFYVPCLGEELHSPLDLTETI